MRGKNTCPLLNGGLDKYGQGCGVQVNRMGGILFVGLQIKGALLSWHGCQSSPFAPQSTFINMCDPIFDLCFYPLAGLIILNAPPSHASTIHKIHSSSRTEAP